MKRTLNSNSHLLVHLSLSYFPSQNSFNQCMEYKYCLSVFCPLPSCRFQGQQAKYRSPDLSLSSHLLQLSETLTYFQATHEIESSQCVLRLSWGCHLLGHDQKTSPMTHPGGNLVESSNHINFLLSV